MTKHTFNHLLFFLILLVCFVACKNETRDYNLGETEYYFDKRLSSISPDQYGAYWIGTETGDLIYFNGNQKQLIELGVDRIYKVTKDVNGKGDSIFWIGIRNSGLQEWKQKSADKLEKLKTYQIPFKKDKYSAYDFVSVHNKLFVATSQGIYWTDKHNDNDSLHLIYPSEKYLAKENGTKFIVQHLSVYKDSLLLASTQNGLFLLNIQTNQARFLLENNFVDYATIYNNTIYSVSNGILYQNDLSGKLIKKTQAENSPKLYYQSQGISFLVGTDELVLSQDLKDFTLFKLRRIVPVQHSKNIIAPDTINHYTYILTENAVWRIANHIDAFKNNVNIKASCATDDENYYLTSDNKLYVQEKNSTNAKWIYTFPENNSILWMGVIGDELYFTNADNQFQKMTVSKSWIRNKLFNSPKVIYKSESRITAVSIKQMGAKAISYLGIQDGLISIDEKNHVDTISAFAREYITSMFGHEYTSKIYFSTLNNGVFYIGEDKEIRQIPETKGVSFIKGIATSDNHIPNLITLTNQYIKSQNPNDSVHVKGYKKLLYVNDTLFYALPENGLHKFVISHGKIVSKGIYFNDINFTPNSCYSDANKILLGSRLGIIMLTPGKENKPVWVTFNEAVNINLFNIIAIILFLMLFSAVVSLYFLKDKKMNIQQVRKRKEDLAKRIEVLLPFADFFENDEKTEINSFNQNIQDIRINVKNKNEVNAKLDKLSLEVADLNRKIALILPKKLEEQRIQISESEAFNKEQLIRQINVVLAQNNFELIRNQILTNEAWLNARKELIEKLNIQIEKLTNCVEIEGVNKNFYCRLLNMKENIKHQNIHTIQEEYAQLEEKIIQINAPESTTLIDKYIFDLQNYINQKIEEERGLIFLSDMLANAINQTANSDNFAKLRSLKKIDRKIDVLKSLDELRSYTETYKEQYQLIVKENEEQVNKKFDKELALYIGEKTENISKKINSLISIFYERLTKAEDVKAFVDILKLNNFQGQHTLVLALLIADPKIKRTLIPGMLGIYGNLNPVISRLISDRMKPNEVILKNYQDTTTEKSIFAYYLLRLLE